MKKLFIYVFFSIFAFAINLQNQDFCFKSRTYPDNYNIIFNSMKVALLNFGMNIKQLNKQNEFISADGTVTQGDYIYKLNFTISFERSKDENITIIHTLVNYDSLKKEDTGKTTATLGGIITTPIPLPWEKAFKYEGSHTINNYKFFDLFYSNFDQELFEYKMKKLN